MWVEGGDVGESTETLGKEDLRSELSPRGLWGS